METLTPVLLPEVFGKNGIKAGCSTRHGGISPPPYHSLNLGMHTGDAPHFVRENRRRFLALVGTRPEELAVGDQVHGADVRVVTRPGPQGPCDGLVTRTPRIALGITVADCAPVLLADPVHHVIAACHAGWRGAAAGIVPRTLEQMMALGARPEHIQAYIGPCISVTHFEVGPEVAEQFPSRYLRHPAGAVRPHLDLKAFLADQLLEAGLRRNHLEVSDACTVTHNDIFYSYRAEGGTCGRLMACILMDDHHNEKLSHISGVNTSLR